MKAPGGVRVRAATITDCAVLAAMRLRLQEQLEQESPALWRMSEARRAALPRFYAESIVDPDVCVLAVEAEAGMIGTATGRIEVGRDVPRFGSIEDVWLDPRHRGQGICKSLMSELVAFFEARGVRELTLGFAAGGSAASVWQHLGFRPAAVIANAPLEELKGRLSSLAHPRGRA
jgi:ribosomal protein S18 acetylase RimI-like enzyme